MPTSEYFDDLVAHEGFTNWLYCDTRGFVTTGVGNLVATPEAAVALPFLRMDGQAASAAEKTAGWSTVKGAFDPNKSADYYRGFSSIRLTMVDVRLMADHRLEAEFIPGIKRLCHDFDSWPLPARKAMVDMAYNLGLGGLAKFHNLLADCQAHDWAKAASDCHRSSCREMRNLWTSQCFIEAAAAS
jgi:GH24 family phage-related lysozyme (muramidase)